MQCGLASIKMGVKSSDRLMFSIFDKVIVIRGLDDIIVIRGGKSNLYAE